MKITKRTIVNTVINALALINSIMVMMGKPVLNISTDEVNMLVSVVFTIVAWVSGFWYNNSFSEAAIRADEYLDLIRNQDFVENKEDDFYAEDDEEPEEDEDDTPADEVQ